MSSYYDENQKTWYCKFYYTDWTGQRKQKLKRGFPRQRDAKDWERNFLEKQQGSPDMAFKSLCELYLEDSRKNCKLSSYKIKNRSVIPISSHTLRISLSIKFVLLIYENGRILLKNPSAARYIRKT